MTNDTKTILLAAGGTGGHMFPAQSLAERLIANGHKVILTTDKRGMRYADGFDERVDTLVLSSASFSQGSIFKRMVAPFLIGRAIMQAWLKMRKTRPDVVVGFGGYPSLPALLVARLTGIAYFIHEQNAVMGRVNKRFHQRAKTLLCGIWPVEGAGDNAKYVGNPVRERVAPLEHAALPKEKSINIVVFGGSQGASALSDIIPAAVAQMSDDLRARLYIVQQAREGEILNVLQRYKNMGVESEIAVFFGDLPERIAAADFVIARAGASSIAEIAFIGRGSVLIPLLSAANDHQRANARALVDAGAAIEHIENRDSATELAAQLTEIFENDAKLTDMAERAYAQARPNATQDVADEIERFLTSVER